MIKVSDYRELEVIITDETWEHIQSRHSEITLESIKNVLKNPEAVYEKNEDQKYWYYYKKRDHPTKTRFFCTIVKVCQEDSFLSTAMTRSKFHSEATQIYP